MTELRVPSIEDAVIRLCTATEPIDRIVVDTYRTTFLAYNTVHGYSQIDFKHPNHRKFKELAAILDAQCDMASSDSFYVGLYLDMIRRVNPNVDVVFAREPSPVGTLETAPGSEPDHSPGQPSHPDVNTGTPGLWRRLGISRRQHSEPAAAPVAPPPPDGVELATTGTTLVAFGDSNTYGTELSEVELGYEDATYRDARAYPRLLARELGVHFGGNLAETGRSNPKIMRRVCDFVTAHRSELDRCLLVIGLTHPSRKAFILKNGWEFLFVNRESGMDPWVLTTMCVELFLPNGVDARVNEELCHKYWVLTTFLKAVGCRHVIYPCWDFGRSAIFFRNRDLGREGVFYFGPAADRFGLRGVVRHLPRGPCYHPLSEGHAHFANVLSAAIRARGLL